VTATLRASIPGSSAEPFTSTDEPYRRVRAGHDWFVPDHVCHAGRSALFGGRWHEPCPNYARNYIGSPEADPIILCDEHFRQVNEAGLVNEPYLGRQEYERREQQRVEERRKGRPWFRRN
jgi:hypothetical protein